MDDLYNTEQRLKTILNKIRSSNFSKGNKEKLEEFTNHCLAESVSKNKTSRYLYDLYNITLWLDKDFEKADIKDIERVLFKLHETKYSEWTKRGYKVIIRKFYKWLRNSKVYPDEVDWIKTTIKENHKKLPEEILTPEEVKRLIDGCIHNRDRALVAFLYDTGCRVGELLHLKIKDIESVEYGMKACLSGKTGMRKVMLVFAVPYLVEWLNQHPKKDPNSYIWVRNDGERLSYGRVRDLLSDIAKRIKLNKKVNPHNFRHSRATHYASSLKEREMMEYFGWRKSDTVGIYVHLSGDAVDKSILRSNGIIIEKEQGKDQLKPIKCNRCGKMNKSTDKFCSMCSLPLDEKTANEIKQKDMEMQEADKVMNQIVKDPEILNLIKKKLNL